MTSPIPTPRIEVPEITVSQAPDELREDEINLAIQYSLKNNVWAKKFLVECAIISACGVVPEIKNLPEAAVRQTTVVLDILNGLDSAERFEYARRMITEIERQVGYLPAYDPRAPDDFPVEDERPVAENLDEVA